MFAPYCGTCQARILLGVESVVAYDSGAGRHAVVLRCRCGRLVNWDAEPPPPPVPPTPTPPPPPNRRWLGLRWAARPIPASRRRQPATIGAAAGPGVEVADAAAGSRPSS
jgi:hypothetical protein